MSAGALTLDFSGRVALVTGGTRGIGAAVADALEASGATVIATGRDPDDCARRQSECREAGSARRYLAVDFEDQDDTGRFLGEVAALERLDVLVNNAGINRVNPLDEASPEDLEALYRVNIRGPVLLTGVAAGLMKRGGYGRVVNVGSIFGVVSRAGRAFYSVSKFGVRGLTAAAALDFAKDGVLVNTISPGFVRTELTERILGPEGMEQAALAVPMGRLAEPEEIARVVLFLASSANSSMTGQNVVVDGGFVGV